MPNDVVPGAGPRHPVRAAADDHRQLRFVVDASDPGRQLNWRAGIEHGRRRLEEQQRLGGQRLLHLGGVIPVVQADAHHLGRAAPAPAHRAAPSPPTSGRPIVAVEEVAAAKRQAMNLAVVLDDVDDLAALATR